MKSRVVVLVLAAWAALIVVLMQVTTPTEACESSADPGCPAASSAPSAPPAMTASAPPPAPSAQVTIPASQAPTASPPPMTFQDEFDGTRLEPHWGRHWPGFGANDWSSRQVAVADGVLTITARREGRRFVSGLIDTVGTFEQRYGTFAARIRLSEGGGLWPAFWLAQPQNKAREEAEIDVMEICLNRPGDHERDVTLLHSYIHKPDGSHAFATRYRTGNLTRAWHVYSVEWRPDRVVFAIDGLVYARFTEAGNIPDMAMAVVLDLAGGGGYCGPPGETTPELSTMEVDWVRVTE